MKKYKTYTIEDMQKLAVLRGGPGAKCLSKKYLGAHTKLGWLCTKHGKFEMVPNNLRYQKSWCHKCSYELRAKNYPHRLSLEEAKEEAKKRGSKCLSKTYISSNRNLIWECKNGHIWNASLSTIKTGVWCKACSSGKGEHITRVILEKLFDCAFESKRHDWLRNSKTGLTLELDGYNESIKLAFEYQGAQHHSPDGFFIKNDQIYKKRKALDDFKRQKCLEKGIHLLIIEQVNSLGNLNKFKIQIESELNRGKVPFDPLKLKGIKLSSIEISTTKGDLYFSRLSKKVEALGGKILSKNFTSSQGLMRFECKMKHRFSTKPAYIMHGNWCPKCGLAKIGDMKRLNIQQVKKIAKENGFICLFDDYQNARTHQKYQCIGCGHIKESTFDNISRGGCPKCAKNLKHTIETCQEAAKIRKGICLSKTYLGARVPLNWQCELGHKWPAAPSGIINQRSWCPECWQIRRTKKGP